MDKTEESLLRQNAAVLRELASHTIWWMTPQEACQSPYRVLAQVMNLGTAEDLHLMLKTFGCAPLKDVIAHAQAGWFDRKHWCFWHSVLELSDPLHVPPLPKRPLPLMKNINVINIPNTSAQSSR